LKRYGLYRVSLKTFAALFKNGLDILHNRSTAFFRIMVDATPSDKKLPPGLSSLILTGVTDNPQKSRKREFGTALHCRQMPASNSFLNPRHPWLFFVNHFLPLNMYTINYS